MAYKINQQSMMQASESFANYEEQIEPDSCRICLQPFRGLIQPYCKCKGNSKYVHQACLLQWAKRTDKCNTKSLQIFFLCDLCQSPIYLDIEKKCRCRQLKEISSLQGISKIQFCLLLSISLIFGIITGFCLKFLIMNNQADIVLLILSIVFGIISFSSLSILLYKIFWSIKKEVIGIKKYEKKILKNRIANSYTIQNL